MSYPQKLDSIKLFNRKAFLFRINPNTKKKSITLKKQSDAVLWMNLLYVVKNNFMETNISNKSIYEKEIMTKV